MNAKRITAAVIALFLAIFVADWAWFLHRSSDPAVGNALGSVTYYYASALKDGKAAGNFIVFADGFAGAIKEPGQSAFRPSGLTVGPGGALYISDDKHGRIWHVTYHGSADSPVAAAPAPEEKIVTVAAPAAPAEAPKQ